jgi:hypothetical protein
MLLDVLRTALSFAARPLAILAVGLGWLGCGSSIIR